MLTVCEMNELLKRWTYKPGWRVEVQAIDLRSDYHSVWVQITFDAEDAFDPGHDILIGMRHTMRVPANEQMFWEQLLCEIDKAERHETREFFKVDGKMLFDPHKSYSPPLLPTSTFPGR